MFEFRLSTKRQKQLFTGLFQMLKTASSQINMSLWKDHMHIQGMDHSHVGLYDLRLMSSWFDEYKITFIGDAERIDICFDANVFYSILSVKNDDQQMTVSMSDEDADRLKIEFKTGGEWKKIEYDKEFYMPLNIYEYEVMSIPVAEYDADFSVSSKKITDTLTQLSKFGTELTMKCDEEHIICESTGGSSGAGMKVVIDTDELSSYSIVENETISMRFSLSFLCKMCICSHLSEETTFYVSRGLPMKIIYPLDESERSGLAYYVAPLVE